MARIGCIRPQARIYNLALGRYENEFEMEQLGKKEPTNGLTARQRVSETPQVQKIIFGGYDAPRYTLDHTEKYYKNVEKTNDMHMTEYEKKIGSRSEGSFMERALSKPYIEIAGKGLNQDIHMSAPALDMLTEQEQYKLMTVYKPSMQKPKTHVEQVEEQVAKLGQPYKTEVISRANQDVRQFMDMNLQETELYPSETVSKGDGGSNLVFNYKEELNKDTNPITRKDLYNENFNNRKAVSNINMRQRDAHTARDVLSTYANKQHNKSEISEKEKQMIANQSIRPAIIKNEKLEQKQEDKVEKEDKGKQVEGNIMFNKISVMNNQNPYRRRYY